MKPVKLLAAVLCLLVATVGFSQTLLTDYGSSDANPFTLTFTDGSFVQGANTGVFSGSGTGLILRGTFSNVDLSAMGNPGSLSLNLTFNSTYSGTIDYLIGSSSGNVIGYTYTASGLSGTLTLSFARNASIDQGAVVLSTINRATLTADNPNFTLNTLSAVSAVPEPATYAALFGVASLGFVAWRKRRAA